VVRRLTIEQAAAARSASRLQLVAQRCRGHREERSAGALVAPKVESAERCASAASSVQRRCVVSNRAG